MNHAELAGGFIASSEDTLEVTPPTAKGGKKIKAKDLKKTIDKYGLQVAADYFNQAITNIQQAKLIVDKVLRRIDYTLKDVD